MKPAVSKHADYTTELGKLGKGSVIHARYRAKGTHTIMERRVKSGLGKKWVPLGYFIADYPGEWPEVVEWAHKHGYAAQEDRGSSSDCYLRRMR